MTNMTKEENLDLGKPHSGEFGRLQIDDAEDPLGLFSVKEHVMVDFCVETWLVVLVLGTRAEAPSSA